MQAAGSRLECPHFARFVRDLAQYFTHLLLHPRLTPAIRHKLLAAAHVLHRLVQSLKQSLPPFLDDACVF